MHEVVVVDDASSDGSGERLEQLAKKYAGHRAPLTLVRKPRNEGKGAALAAGLPSVTGDVIIIQDADLEYNPEDYKTLLGPLLSGQADVVYGSRFKGGNSNVLLFWHAVANRVLTLACNLLSNLNLSDVWTGYKAFRAEILRGMPLRSKGFGFEPEITIKIAKLGCRIYEVPIGYEGRTYAEGKKIGVKDAVTGILSMLRAWLSADLGPLAVGEQTLRIMSRAWRYNTFLYDVVRPYMGKRVIELGSGVGNISRMLLDRDQLVLTDYDESYVERLEHRYHDWDYVETLRLNMIEPGSGARVERHWNQYDSAVCFQVLEHIEDDLAAMKTAYRLVKPGGNFIVMVPAHQAIYGDMDRALGHFRRYDAADLREKLESAGFAVEELRLLNPIAVPGWWLNGKILKRKVIPNLQLALFDRLTPLVRFLARWRLGVGLVVLAVAVKKKTSEKRSD